MGFHSQNALFLPFLFNFLTKGGGWLGSDPWSTPSGSANVEKHPTISLICSLRTLTHTEHVQANQNLWSLGLFGQMLYLSSI
jgi:hypothetical protein